ncbi:MAG: hypothetical protein BHV92_01380 [Clostridiales bacterium 45_37]|nr:MAG: hypothetical protein BHV92_01380 [Clostridiales bacterium 45_37]
MDRNEKQNSFRNIQNSRGRDRKLKKYQTAFHISLAAAVIFAGSTGVLGVQYLNLKNQDTKVEENTVTADAENGKEETKTASAEKKDTKKEETASAQETVTPTVTETDTKAVSEETETPTPTTEETKTSDQAEEFQKLENNLKNKIPENTVVQITGIGGYDGSSYSSSESGKIEGVDNLPEYAKLFIVGDVYKRISDKVYIRENDEKETDLAKIVQGALDRNSESDNYNDNDNKSSRELLLRIGESEDKKDQREEAEDDYGYVSRDKDNKDDYDADIKNGVDEVNKYIAEQLQAEEKTIKEEPADTLTLANTLTLADCEAYLKKQLTEGNEKLFERLDVKQDDANILSAIQEKTEKNDNITRIWLSGAVGEDQEITTVGIYNAKTEKGYLLSVLYNKKDADESEISSITYETLM